MTATAPSRIDALSVAAVLLLVLSGLLALSGLFVRAGPLDGQMIVVHPGYYDSWAMAAYVAPASVLPTLVLVAAAAVRGSRAFLLVASGLTVLHLASLLMLAGMAGGGLADRAPFRSGAAVLGLTVVGLALAWWDASRAERRPWIALLPVVLSPALGLLFDTRLPDLPWDPLMAACW